ncbi:Serine/threonine-protein kinase AFC2 [Capsicum annuum]|uniref:Serine/threonine-protein kinase AFC2 n=1 Tax=Capsicum annuum TaxID=4072 RepID=A0A2G3A490_CAPAN|nr:Serine/threonine-protein kinase AFC2 [Capsicum annuum]
MKKYRDATMIDVEIIQKLGKHDNSGNHCVQIRNWFDYRNYICIVFEKLGPSLYDFLRKNNYHSIPIDLVREIGRQLLDFMHDLCLIHTNLKPENILLTFPKYIKVPDYKVSSRSPKDGSYYKRIPKLSAIKVIDFGSIIYDHLNQTYVVSTRHYHEPKVILGLGWAYTCDIWSVGCILVKLCSIGVFQAFIVRDTRHGQGPGSGRDKLGFKARFMVSGQIGVFRAFMVWDTSHGQGPGSGCDIQEFQDSQSKSLPTLLEVQYCNGKLRSWVIPLFEDYNDNMDVPDENSNEDAPLSHREYENFCFICKQLLQIENQ